MAFDVTSIDFRSGLHGVVFDHSEADGTTQPLVAWDTTSQKIYIHLIKLSCYSGKVAVFDGSGGVKIARLMTTESNYVTEQWDFHGDPVQCDGTTNLCVSGSGVFHGLVKYELGV